MGVCDRRKSSDGAVAGQRDGVARVANGGQPGAQRWVGGLWRRARVAEQARVTAQCAWPVEGGGRRSGGGKASGAATKRRGGEAGEGRCDGQDVEAAMHPSALASPSIT